MPALKLPTLVIETVVAVAKASRPLLVNRDPGPAEADVPIDSTIALEVVDPGPDGIARAATRVWVDGVVAFDGSLSPAIAASFGAPRAAIIETADTLRIVLDPVMPLASLATVAVRVVAETATGGLRLDETYSFEVEDRTAPRVVAAIAIAPRVIRLAFDEPIAVIDPSGFMVAALAGPAVPLSVVSAAANETLIDLMVSTEMTPDVPHRVRVTGVADRSANAVAPPFDQTVFAGFRPPRPARRRFDLWSMLPKHNRRSDLTGDLARFIACLQEVVDLLLAEVDRFPEIFDLDRAPEAFLDLILHDLGNPFAFELDVLGKRRLAATLVDMYRQKGTAPGIRNAVRFFLGIEIDAITPLTATGLVLGESILGEDWELGPSDRFARYAFDVQVGRILTPQERKQLRTIVAYLKPAHTHFVNLIEPVPPIVPDHWELGISALGETSCLH